VGRGAGGIDALRGDGRQHQVWRIDLPVGFARALAGSGRENIVDGPTETSAFAQSSGLCVMGGRLYVADSEVSAVRCIDMATEG